MRPAPHPVGMEERFAAVAVGAVAGFGHSVESVFAGFIPEGMALLSATVRSAVPIPASSVLPTSETAWPYLDQSDLISWTLPVFASSFC